MLSWCNVLCRGLNSRNEDDRILCRCYVSDDPVSLIALCLDLMAATKGNGPDVLADLRGAPKQTEFGFPFKINILARRDIGEVNALELFSLTRPD